MLHYPSHSTGPLFQFLAKKTYLESPDQDLSLELYFRSFAHTHTEMRRIKKFSTIRPLPGTHRFSL